MATSTTQDASGSSKKDRTKIYIAIGAVVIVVVALVFLAFGSGGASTTTILPLTNSSPIYMSIPQAQELLGSPIINYPSNYTATSLYNFTFPLNISTLEYGVPTLSGNVTNGWVTVAFGTGKNNASIEYLVIQTASAPLISTLFAQEFLLTLSSPPTIIKGQKNGMNYTYENFTNSSGSFRMFAGWKDGYVSVAYLQANRAVSNLTQIAQVVSSNIP